MSPSALADRDAVVVSVRRGPIGRARKGSLAGERPEDLAVSVVRAALADIRQLSIRDLDDFYLGCAVPEGAQNENPARRVAVLAGMDSLPAVTVNRFCASSVQALRMAANAVRAGDADAVLVGGMESVSSAQQRDQSRHPAFDEPGERAEQLFRNHEPWSDPREDELLPDVYMPMGMTAEFVARTTSTSRAEQDAWALESQLRAARAIDSGFFAREITAYRRSDGSTVDTDDGPRPTTTLEGLAGLPPAFLADGTVTAGNASPLNDGASAAVVMSAGRAAELGITPLARILGSSATALSPEVMGLGPVEATRTVLRRTGMTLGDIDIIELNEAFAAQVVPTVRQLDLDPDRVNPFGGAIALGHPFGATGVRMLATLLNGLRTRDQSVGLLTLCVGGGQGMGMIVERLT